MMGCVKNCGRCCGPVPVSQTDMEEIRRYVSLHSIEAMDNGPMTCPFLGQDKGCLIYAVRPLVCRLFGTVSTMECPNGCDHGSVDEDCAMMMLRSDSNGVVTSLHFEFGRGSGIDALDLEIRKLRSSMNSPQQGALK